MLLPFLRRCLAIVLSLSVQWSALGQAFVACADMDAELMPMAATGAMVQAGANTTHTPSRMAAMSHPQDARDDVPSTTRKLSRLQDAPAADERAGMALCCLTDSPPPDDRGDVPADACAKMPVCAALMLPASAVDASPTKPVADASPTATQRVPSRLPSAPDAPPPRA